MPTDYGCSACFFVVLGRMLNVIQRISAPESTVLFVSLSIDHQPAQGSVSSADTQAGASHCELVALSRFL
jgi:hypothetical protein